MAVWREGASLSDRRPRAGRRLSGHPIVADAAGAIWREGASLLAPGSATAVGLLWPRLW